MPGPCSDDLRTIAVEKVLAGESRRSVAKQLRMAASTVTGWFKRQSDTGTASPKPMGGRREPKLEGHRTWIQDRIEACPATALAGLRDLLGERGVAASGASTCRFLKSCGITRKKSARVADERNRPDPERRRKRWKRFQGKADSRRLVFIDETWMKTSMSPRHGWSPKGRRAYGSAPFSHWFASTFVAALRHDRIDAPWVLDGLTDGGAFRIHVETQQVPTPGRGDIAVMDNLGSRKAEAVRAAIRGASACPLFLPPCGSDPDPVEQVFAKPEHFLRKDRPRTRDDLWRNVGEIPKKFSPEECANCLVDSGYAAVQPG